MDRVGSIHALPGMAVEYQVGTFTLVLPDNIGTYR